MGLVKTLQSLAVADYYSDKWPWLRITKKNWSNNVEARNQSLDV